MAFRPIVRRFALVTLAVGLGLVFVLLSAHLPWVQARVMRWAVSQVAGRGIRIQTSSLTYNLLTRTVHVEGLIASISSTAAGAQPPFLEAGRLDVTLPRSVLFGRLAISSLSGDRVRITLLRRQDGSTNFPQNQRGAPGGASSFPIDTLTVSNVSVEWRDDVLGAGVVAAGVSVNLQPTARDAGGASGTIAFDRPATLRVGEHTTSVGGASQIAWDGARLSFESLRLQAPEATLSAAGSVGLLTAAHLVAVEGRGSADLDRVAAWFALSQRPLGSIAFQVHVSGTAAEPNADVTLTSQNLAWESLTGVSVDAAMHIDAGALDTGRFTVRGLGGVATGRGRLSFAAGGERARAAIDWQNIDAATLLAALGEKTPVIVGARLDGHATASWARWGVDGLTGDLQATTRNSPPSQPAPHAPRARASLGFGGTVTLNVRNGEWRGTIDQQIDRAVHVEGRANGRLAAASLAASTVDATVVATADSLPEVWRTLHDLDLVPTAPPATLPGGARATLTVSGRVDNPSLAGSVAATLPALDQLRADSSSPLRPSGVLSLSATVSGTARAPAIEGQLAGEALAIAGQHADRLDGSFGLDTQTAHLERLVLTQPGGRLTLNGRYDMHTGAITALATASNLIVSPVPGTQPGEILVPLTARLNGDVQLNGTVADPQGSGQLTLEDTHALERDIGRVSMRLTLADHQLRAAVDLADLFTTGTATLALASPKAAAPKGAPGPGGVVPGPGAFVLDTQTTDGNLAMLASRLGIAAAGAANTLGEPVAGLASFTAHVEGVRSDIAHARAMVSLQRLEATVGDVPVRSTEPGRASYDGRLVDVASVTLAIGPGGRSQLRAAGQLGADNPGTLVASLDGQAGDLQQLALVFLPAGSVLSRVQLEGRVHVDARAPGSLVRPALTAEASLDAGQIAVAGQSQQTTIAARASYGEGVVKLSQLDAAWQAARLSATGEIPIALVAPDAPAWLTGGTAPARAGGRLQARFDSVTPAVLAPFVPAETMAQLGGLVSGTLTLDADRPSLAAVRGQLILDRADLSVAGVAFTQQQPTRVDVAGGRAQIAAWNWGGAGNSFSLSGGFKFDGAQALDLAVDGTVDLRALGAFLPRVSTGGQGVLKARITGAPTAPQLDGRIDVQRGELRVTSPRLVISDLAGTLLLSQDAVTLQDVEGQANGGMLSISGA